MLMDREFIWDLFAKKLSGEATQAELVELYRELHQNPDLHYSLQTIHDLWGSKPVYPASSAEKAFENHLKKMQDAGIFISDNEQASFIPGKNRSFLRNSGPVFWIAVFLACGFLTANLLKTPGIDSKTAAVHRNPTEITTRNGSKINLLLPDGTKVWLNAGSKLNYDTPYSNTIREVTLSGEAFFDVVKNPSRPFIIHIGKINIEVLGTAFNVKSYPGDKTIETSLIRGSIEVTFNDHSSKKIILNPNQKLVVSSEAIKAPEAKQTGNLIAGSVVAIDHLNHFGSDSIITETAWVQNKLIFQDESFVEVARKMERWYGIKIAFDDSAVKSLHFTGSFSAENIEQAMNALQLTAQFYYTLHNHEIKITSNQN